MMRVVPAPAGNVTSGKRSSRLGCMRVAPSSTAGEADQEKSACPMGVDAMPGRDELPAITAKSSSPSATRCSSTWPIST
ncbi:hypothetical protein D9M68_965150 [compost metagenome]